MTELTLNPGSAATAPAGDKQLAEPRVMAVQMRRREEGRARRRFSATRLMGASDDGFRLFRVY